MPMATVHQLEQTHTTLGIIATMIWSVQLDGHVQELNRTKAATRYYTCPWFQYTWSGWWVACSNP